MQVHCNKANSYLHPLCHICTPLVVFLAEVLQNSQEQCLQSSDGKKTCVQHTKFLQSLSLLTASVSLVIIPVRG